MLNSKGDKLWKSRAEDCSPSFKARFVKADMSVVLQVHIKADWEKLDREELLAHGQSSWRLTCISTGREFPLPPATIFLGRDNMCDIHLESRSVSEHHAMLNYDSKEEKFRVKDLNSCNGTFLNDSRIPEDEFYTVDHKDTLHFGYDPTVFRMEQTEDSSTPQVEPLDSSPSIHQGDTECQLSPDAGEPPVSAQFSALLSAQINAPVSAWAPKEDASLAEMAECSGCIAEQGLQHTCGNTEEEVVGNPTNLSAKPPLPSTTAPSHVPHSSRSLGYGQNVQVSPQLTQGEVQAAKNQWSEVAYHPSYHDYPYVTAPATDLDYIYAGADGYTPTDGSTYYDSTKPTVDDAPQQDQSPPHLHPRPTVHVVRHIFHPPPPHHPVHSSQHHPRPPGQFQRPPPAHHPTTAYPLSYVSTYHPEPYLFPQITPKSGRTKTLSNQDKASENAEPSRDVNANVCLPAQNQNVPPSSQSVPTQSQATQHAQAVITQSTTAPGQTSVTLTFGPKSTVQSSTDSPTSDSPANIPAPPSATDDTAFIIPVSADTFTDAIHETPEQDTVSTTSSSSAASVREFTATLRSSPFLATVARDDDTSPTTRKTSVTRQDQRRAHPDEEPDLSTIKKGTPLYGQPSWWGEEDADHYKYPHTATLSDKSKGLDQTAVAERPTALTYAVNPVTAMSSATDNLPPLTSTTSNGTDGQPTDRARAHSPPERDPGPGSVESPDTAANKSNTAFTIDFGDEDAKGGTDRPIGEFMPSGLRRSFRQREQEIREKLERKKEERDVSNGDMSPARTRKSYPMSPATQRKSDQWKNANVTRKHSLSPRRSGYTSDGHNSNRSSDNEDHSIRSDTYGSSRTKKFRTNGRSVSVTEKTSTSISTRASNARAARTALADSRKTQAVDIHRPPVDKRIKSDGRKTSVDRKTPIERRTPVDRKTPVDRRTPTNRKTPVEQRSTPTSEKTRKTSTAESQFLIQKMFQSQSGSNEEIEVELDATEYKLYRDSHKVQKTTVIKPRPSRGIPKQAKNQTAPVPDDDNLSETGTYTIQTDKMRKEIDDARRSIDTVFRVGCEEEEDAGEMSDQEFSPDELPEDPRGPILPEMVDSMDPIVGSMVLRGDEHGEVEDDEYGGTEAQWHPQFKSAVSSEHQDETAPLHSVPARRVRGSGRKLPTPPVRPAFSTQCSDPKANTSFDYGVKDTHIDTDSPGGRHRATVTYDSESGGTFTVSFDAPQREGSNRKTDDEDNSESDVYHSEVSTEVSSERMRSTKAMLSSDSRKLASTDRMVEYSTRQQTQHKRIVIVNKDSVPVSKEELLIPIKHDSDSDSSSGHAAQVSCSPRAPRPSKEKPKFSRSKSAGVELTKGKDSPRSPRGKSTERRSISSTRAAQEASATRLSTSRRSTSRTRGTSLTRDLSTSDGPSDPESGSILSSSTDFSEAPNSPRAGRKGKAPITVTRTNRTFALRRQKTEGDESGRSDGSSTTLRSSRPSSTGTDAPTSPRVSSRSSSNTRSRSVSRSRSRPVSGQESGRGTKVDSGLGQRIVDKSRENTRLSSSAGAKDIAALKVNSSRTTTTVVSKTSHTSQSRSTEKSKERRPRSGSSRSGATSAGSSNKSQPSSRSNSPRSQEYNAWKRRKSYDPRQAVAEAKTKKGPLRSKSTGATEPDDQSTGHSVSSLSSEDSAKVEDIVNDTRTNDIIKLSTEIYENLAAMSKETDNEEAEVLLNAEYEFRRRLSSHGAKSAFSSVYHKKSPAVDSPSPDLASGESLSNLHENVASDGQSDSDQTDTPDSGKPLKKAKNHVTWQQEESYNTIILRSIHEISNRVKTRTDGLMEKLQRSHDLKSSPCADDLKLDKDTPGLSELGGILTNLRTTEKHLQMIEKALFPGPKSSGPLCDRRHLQELERIRSELADFRPIEQPARRWGQAMHKQASQDSDRSDALTGDDYY